jgi:Ferritin-like domain
VSPIQKKGEIMETKEKDILVRSDPKQEEGTSRRAFLHRAAIAGAVGAAGLGSLLTLASPEAKGSNPLGHDDHDENGDDLKQRDHDILIAAEIAEALAVTTYTNIIDAAPFFTRLASDDQGYLVAARQEEMSHYLLEQSVTDQPSPFKSFFYPKDMFQDAQTTLNVLVTLEDAFIAAYLVGVRHFSTPDLRVTSALIMGIESDNRTLARVLAAGVAAQDGGPIENVTGAQGVEESIDPPNNNGYERTLCWTNIKQAVAALTSFADINAAKSAGFDISRSFGFDPFTPKLPNPLEDFVSFKGC